MTMTNELKELLPDPVKTVAALDKHIIGQAEAKRALALSLLNRAVRRLGDYGIVDINVPIQKSNVLMVGPTGVGKTSLIKQLSDICDIPITMADITSMTASGYVGGSLDTILINHVKSTEDYITANYQRFIEDEIVTSETDAFELLEDMAENGIIYIDEIDKAKQRDSGKSDPNGDMVQNELLKFLDTGEVDLTENKNHKCHMSSIRTDNILFICGGAFSGLTDIIAHRLKKNSTIGFVSDYVHNESLKEELLKFVTTEDLIEYGFKPEFLGRLPVRAILHPLTLESMQRVIIEPVNSVYNQYVQLMKILGFKLKIEKDALTSVAKHALALKTGARALKPIFERILTDHMFNSFSINTKSIVITEKLVQEKLNG